ncbi:hypothetical protein MKZ38_008313 [Zalerion maritima]|uniref:small monomeric GTPase n=1 Tax=Zalerion maritima TaxID=339359 RepID=A0AAD5RHN0_9PEZI|nr:hypothetical protein MKZ38_008313 [Zalerion maritima]
MAEVLGVVASITGILTAAGEVAKILGPYVSGAKKTPDIAALMHWEVRSIQTILSGLEKLVNNFESIPRSRKALIPVEQFVAVLNDGVLMFSELEASLPTKIEALSANGRPTFVTRLQWVRRESSLKALHLRLQSFKSSVSVMLALLERDAGTEAPSLQRRLSQKINALHGTNNALANLAERFTKLEDTIVGRRRDSIQPRTTSRSGSGLVVFGFEDDLMASRPYRQAVRDTMDFTFTTSLIDSKAWSRLSRFSLSDLSDLSVIGIPISKAELKNPHHYKFERIESTVIDYNIRETIDSRVSSGDGTNDSIMTTTPSTAGIHSFGTLRTKPYEAPLEPSIPRSWSSDFSLVLRSGEWLVREMHPELGLSWEGVPEFAKQKILGPPRAVVEILEFFLDEATHHTTQRPVQEEWAALLTKLEAKVSSAEAKATWTRETTFLRLPGSTASTQMMLRIFAHLGPRTSEIIILLRKYLQLVLDLCIRHGMSPATIAFQIDSVREQLLSLKHCEASSRMKMVETLMVGIVPRWHEAQERFHFKHLLYHGPVLVEEMDGRRSTFDFYVFDTVVFRTRRIQSHGTPSFVHAVLCFSIAALSPRIQHGEHRCVVDTGSWPAKRFDLIFRTVELMDTWIGVLDKARIAGVGDTAPRKYRIAVLGSYGVGKSKLITQFTAKNQASKHNTAMGALCSTTTEMDGNSCNLDILDTSGEPGEDETVPDSTISECDGFLVVYSVCDRETFLRAERIITMIYDGKKTPRIPIVLAGNMCFSDEERHIGFKEGDYLAKSLGSDFLEMDTSENAYHVEMAFNLLVRRTRDLAIWNTPAKPPESDNETEMGTEVSDDTP